MTPRELREQWMDEIRSQQRGRFSTKCKKDQPGFVTADLRRTSLPLVDSPLPCIHLGPVLRDQKCGCQSKLRKCDVHGLCTTGEKRDGVALCRGCDDFRTRETADDVRRHLIYFVYPVSDNGMWQWNIDQLRSYASLFNGRRVIAICNAPAKKKHRLDPVADVRKYAGDEFEFIYISQHKAKNLGEVTAFPALMKAVAPWTTDLDFTFYGHAKGVLSSTRTPATKGWADLMYRVNLSDWGRVEASLRDHLITGAFRCPASMFPWHYSGTFFWFRNDAVFSRKWENIPQRYGGVEMWPSAVFDHSESGCLFGDNISGMSLYSMDKVEEVRREWDGQS